MKHPISDWLFTVVPYPLSRHSERPLWLLLQDKLLFCDAAREAYFSLNQVLDQINNSQLFSSLPTNLKNVKKQTKQQQKTIYKQQAALHCMKISTLKNLHPNS